MNKAVESALSAAAQLANFAFNLAQKPGYLLTTHDCALLKRLQVQWDDNRAVLEATPADPAYVKETADSLIESRICKQEPAPAPEPVAWIDRHDLHRLRFEDYADAIVRPKQGRYADTPLYAAQQAAQEPQTPQEKMK